jgi:hypothetical protein
MFSYQTRHFAASVTTKQNALASSKGQVKFKTCTQDSANVQRILSRTDLYGRPLQGFQNSKAEIVYDLALENLLKIDFFG